MLRGVVMAYNRCKISQKNFSRSSRPQKGLNPHTSSLGPVPRYFAVIIEQKETRAGIFKQSMGDRNRLGIGFSYRPSRLRRLAEFIPWNRFLGSINV
jgi:hypothetical protein